MYFQITYWFSNFSCTCLHFYVVITGCIYDKHIANNSPLSTLQDNSLFSGNLRMRISVVLLAQYNINHLRWVSKPCFIIFTLAFCCPPSWCFNTHPLASFEFWHRTWCNTFGARSLALYIKTQYCTDFHICHHYMLLIAKVNFYPFDVGEKLVLASFILNLANHGSIQGKQSQLMHGQALSFIKFVFQ